MDDLNLPVAYGKTRLVLLVVDPYLIHAYWEIAPERLREAKKLAGQTKAVLRFYKESKMASKDMLPEWFDIEIDLESRNWYVHIWNPEESLFADLALKRNDGTLIALARSQVVHMPRVHPAIAIDQRFMRVETTERRADIVPAPLVEHDRPRESIVPPANEPPVVRPIVRPIDSAEIVREALKDVYASVQWRHRRFEPEGVHVVAISTSLPVESDTDLTAIAERNLPSGLSSGLLQKSRQEPGPDVKR
jgi:hypothetical protein